MDDSQRRRLLANATSSGAGTMVAELVMSPLCAVKTMLQNSQEKNSTAIKVATRMYAIGGVRPFFAASAVAMSTQYLSSVGKYVLYRELELALAQRPFFVRYPDGVKPASGIMSGILVSLLTHPLDWKRVQLQVGASSASAIAAPAQFQAGVYSGYRWSLLKTSIGSALFFPLFDKGREFGLPSPLAGVLSACVSSLASQPADYCKTRALYGNFSSHGWNIAAYYRGLTVNLARVVPHFTIAMTVTEHLRS